MKRILIIEDDRQVRGNLAFVLKSEGFAVSEAGDGVVGLAAARSDPPDLILCDITMPGRDGLAVLRALRADPAVTAVPFIFITARATQADLRAGMNLGADDYLPKPFAIEDLLAAIAARLTRAGQAAPRGGTNPKRLERLGLTAREAEVLHWVGCGKSNPDIATILGLGVATVKTHLIHIFEKLGLENRAAAMLRALEVPDV